MSSLYRSAISARMAKLPKIQERESTGEEDAIITGMGPPPLPPQTSRARGKAKSANPKFAPLSAEGYFTHAYQVHVSSTKLDHRVYYSPPSFSGGSVMVFHHGAGYSGLSFACVAKEMTDMTKGECGALSLDARRHGKTTLDNDEDLSIEILEHDFVELLRELFPDPKTTPTFVLVGHSMGGSVVVRACPRLLEGGYKVAGVAVLDVVEGFAMEALPEMHSLLNMRPEGFESIDEAIEWHVTTNTIRNANSARISIPPILVPSASGTSLAPAYVWRTPLRSTAPYWSTWFSSLSSKFLAIRTARLLILAGTDRLDKELMIGQMQGKFQMEVVSGVGHMLHEDNPTRLAEILVDFWRRNDKVIAGIKKVGEA